MIRINLLPVRAKKKRSSSILQLAAMASAGVISLGVSAGVLSYYADEVADREDKIAKGKQQIAELKKIIGEVNELDKRKQRLLQQLAVIEKLEKGKLGPVRVLDELGLNIPKRVWITSFVEGRGDLNLKGTGLENADISEFMRGMQRSKYFDDVRLKYTQSTTKDGVTIYNFEITAKVNYSA